MLFAKDGGQYINDPCFGGMKQSKCMVILRDFPHNSALFGLGIYILPPGRPKLCKDAFVVN